MNTHYVEDLPMEWDPIAKIFMALGDRYRQTIFLLFEPEEEISLKTIVELIPLSRSAVVHHVMTLQHAGLLVGTKRGREVFYRPNIELFDQATEIFNEYTDSLRNTKKKKKKK